MSAVADSILMLTGAVGRAWLTCWWPLTVATGALLGVAWLGERLLERRVAASLRLLLYLAVLVRLAFPAGWHSPLGLLPATGGMTSVAEVAPAMPPAPEEVVWLAPPPGDDLVVGRAWGLPEWLGLGYLLVAAVLLGRMAWARVRLARQLREATPLPGLAAEVPVVRHPRLGPFVAGVWRPCVVLPPVVADAGAEEARALVLRHELAHVRRRDPLITLLLQIVCALAWPLAPVWLAVARVRGLIEIACDERAVGAAGGAERRRYAELLLALAGATGGGSGSWAHVMRFGSPLGARLRGLAVRRRWPVPLQAAVMAAAAAVAVACAGEPGAGEEDGAVMADAADVADGIPAAGGPGAATTAGREWTTRSPQPARVLDTAGWPRSGVPATGAASAPDRLRLDPAVASAVPGGGVFVTPPSSSGPPAALAKRQHAPVLMMSGDDSMWLGTRRGGTTRVDTWKPLEAALREAIADSGGHTLLINHSSRTSPERMRQVMTVAKRAGAFEIGLVPSTTDIRFRRGKMQPALLPALERGAPAVVTLTPYRDPVLTITGSGALYLYSELVTLDRLESQLARTYRRGGTNTLLVSGDPAAIRNAADDVIAAARRAGAINVAVLSGAPFPPPPR
jgi:biopolymer transport protein ExbD